MLGRLFVGNRWRRGGKLGAARWAVLAVLSALLVAGCSNNPYPKGETARPALYVALSYEIKTLDPTIAYTINESQVIDLIYPSYFRYHYLKQDPYELELSLGAAEPERRPYVYQERKDGRTVTVHGEEWTFRIKRGLRFQDDPAFPNGKGREITAADFLFAFRRMADPGLTQPCPVFPFFSDKILGLQAYADYNQHRKKQGLGMDWDAPVEGLVLDPKDPYVFTVRLNQPYPQLRYLMAMHFTTPLAREAVLRYGNDLRDYPVGSGPYMLQEYKKKQHVTLVRNPNAPAEIYPTEGGEDVRNAGLLAAAGRPLPMTEKIVFSYQREGVTAWNLFLQGYLDRWLVTQENMHQVVTQTGSLSPEMERLGVQMFQTASPSVTYFGFNMEDPVVGGYTPEKRKLRQAISLAIDSQAFIDLFYQGSGIPGQWMVPPSIGGYDPEYRNPYRQYNLQRAKQLLAEAGYPNGISKRTGERLTIFHDNRAVTADFRQRVGLVQKQLAELGIRLESRVWRPVVLRDKIRTGQFQFVLLDWYADYPDPENFTFLLYGPNRRPGPNNTAYHNPEYDRLFEQMRVLDDGREREALIRRMREIAVEDCAVIPVLHEASRILVHGWVSGMHPHGVAYDTLKYWSVDGAKRASLQAAWNQPNFWPAIALAALLVFGSLPAAAVIRKHRTRRVRRKPAPSDNQVS